MAAVLSSRKLVLSEEEEKEDGTGSSHRVRSVRSGSRQIGSARGEVTRDPCIHKQERKKRLSEPWLGCSETAAGEQGKEDTDPVTAGSAGRAHCRRRHARAAHEPGGQSRAPCDETARHARPSYCLLPPPLTCGSSALTKRPPRRGRRRRRGARRGDGLAGKSDGRRSTRHVCAGCAWGVYVRCAGRQCEVKSGGIRS